MPTSTCAPCSPRSCQQQIKPHDLNLYPLPHLPRLNDKFTTLHSSTPNPTRHMTSGEAVQAFLSLAAQQLLYGVDLFPAVFSTGDAAFVGVCAAGIRLTNGKLQPLDLHRWSTVREVTYDGRKVAIVIKPHAAVMHTTTNTVTCPSRTHAEALWASVVQRHTFFRHRRQPTLSQTSSIKRILGRPASALERAHVVPDGQTEFQITGAARSSSNSSSAGDSASTGAVSNGPQVFQRRVLSTRAEARGGGRQGSAVFRRYSSSAHDSVFRSRSVSLSGGGYGVSVGDNSSTHTGAYSASLAGFGVGRSGASETSSHDGTRVELEMDDMMSDNGNAVSDSQYVVGSKVVTPARGDAVRAPLRQVFRVNSSDVVLLKSFSANYAEPRTAQVVSAKHLPAIGSEHAEDTSAAAAAGHGKQAGRRAERSSCGWGRSYWEGGGTEIGRKRVNVVHGRRKMWGGGRD